MAYELWSQDVFTKGELSPYMYARATVNEYGNGLKVAQNVMTFPTGAAGKRFGTLFDATLNASITSATQVYFQSFQYLNECVYQLVIAGGNVTAATGKIYVYLEGGLVATINNSFSAEVAGSLITTTLNTLFRMTGSTIKPYDLTRAADSGNVVTAATGNVVTLTSSTGYSGLVIPFQITHTGGTQIVTSPQIIDGVTYFAKFLSNTTFQIYATSSDARYGTNMFTVTGAGTGTTTVLPLNTWALNPTTFTSVPFFDFNSPATSYDALTFTPSAATGSITVTVSGGGYAPLVGSPSPYIGGAFFGGGGSGRITAVASATSFTVSVSTPFPAATALLGSLCLLAEPAWSDARGWPSKCSSYQNRALFANTTSLPNGFWASVINDYSNFGDLTTDDDDAISWFPTSNDINFIRFIVPYRSITVHTNSGIYSSPLSDVVAITPNNFTLQLQDSTPADVLQPQAIDNQILVLSGNDAHQMLWDGINNAYTSDIVSVINEQTIRNPVDETAFADLRRAGSRFVFITNADGSLAVYQTLISQNVSGFTPQIMDQYYGNAYFRQTCSSSDGRCWFLTQRQFADSSNPSAINIAITGYTAATPTTESYLHAVSSNLSTTVPTAITFTTSGTLPASNPQIAIQLFYWAIGKDADNFYVYLSQEDALAGANAISFTSAGTSSNVVSWPLSTLFNIEELTFDTYLDCAIYYNGSPLDVLGVPGFFNAQNVKMIGDGFGFDYAVRDATVEFIAHGSLVNVSEAYVGFPITTIMEPMPLICSNGPSAKNTTLTKPKHIRSIRFMFNNTIGGTINGVPIALDQFDMANIGEPPMPSRGYVEIMPFKGWDDFNTPSWTIEHSEPFPIELLGVFYSVEL